MNNCRVRVEHKQKETSKTEIATGGICKDNKNKKRKQKYKNTIKGRGRRDARKRSKNVLRQIHINAEKLEVHKQTRVENPKAIDPQKKRNKDACNKMKRINPNRRNTLLPY